jgi:hypothetical protein
MALTTNQKRAIKRQYKMIQRFATPTRMHYVLLSINQKVNVRGNIVDDCNNTIAVFNSIISKDYLDRFLFAGTYV